jgi:hypothetical protein
MMYGKTMYLNQPIFEEGFLSKSTAEGLGVKSHQ